MKLYFWIGVGVAVIIAAYAGYRHELGQIPYQEMNKAEARIAARAGGVNAMVHMPRATAQARTVVRPSPDQLYSACVYDLSKGPVEFNGTTPDNAYWSLSFFAHNSDNFYVINDRKLTNREFRFVLLRENEKAPSGVSEQDIVRSPTKTGVVLQRVFIGEEARADELNDVRSQTSCAVLQS